ncbi:reverse transcriptase domain-containing protein [Tanacetum coccineum]
MVQGAAAPGRVQGAEPLAMAVITEYSVKNALENKILGILDLILPVDLSDSVKGKEWRLELEGCRIGRVRDLILGKKKGGILETKLLTNKKRFIILLKYLKHPSFHTLLNLSEEEFGYDHPMEDARSINDVTILADASRNLETFVEGRSDAVHASVSSTKPGNMTETVLKSVPTVKESTLKLFASLVTNEDVTSKVNFRYWDSDKPINAKAEVKIPKAYSLDVHSRFGCSLYGYFVGRRVAFLVVKYYVKNAWNKFGLVGVMMILKVFFFFKFASIEDGLSVMTTKLGNPIMLETYTSSMCIQSRGRMDYARALIDISMNGNHLDVVCVWYLGMMICYVQNGMLKNLRNNTQNMMVSNILILLMVQMWVLRFILSLRNLFGKSSKNSASLNGTEKNYEVSGKVASSANPFDALNTIEEADELGSNGESYNSGKKVVKDVPGSISGNLSNLPFAARINEMEGKKPLKPCKPTPPNSSYVVSKKVDDLVNENRGNKSLYEQWKENHDEFLYDDDDFDDPSLSDAQLKFANAFDINLRGQLR